jgi:hypothetical protein
MEQGLMDIDRAANIAEIMGGIAILVSLIYVGYQIRQSNQIAAAESMRTIMGSEFLDSHNMATIGRGFLDFNALDFDSKWEFHTYFMRFFNHYQMIGEQRDRGLIRNSDVDIWTEVVASVVLTNGVQQYWNAGARDHYNPVYVKIIEDYIQANRESITAYTDTMPWMKEAH